jgi:hypothetical protein
MQCHLCVGAARASYVAALFASARIVVRPFCNHVNPWVVAGFQKKSIVNVGESGPRAEHVAS